MELITQLKFRTATLFLVVLLTQESNAQNIIVYAREHGPQIATTYQKANCVELMDKLLKGYLHIDKQTSNRIYVNIPLTEVEKRLKQNDTAIVAGVAFALVNAGLADWVTFGNIQAGDIVQYWIYDNESDFLYGHCGIYDGKNKANDDDIQILGSHPDTKGYGIITESKEVLLKNHLFICRLKTNIAHYVKRKQS